MGPLCVFNYNIVIELWVMKTENNQNVFLVFITHNSKIRELNDGNRVMDFPNNLFAIGPTIFELWVMKTENWVTKTGHPVWLHFLITQFPLLIAHHSSIITHHPSLNFPHSFGIITQFPCLFGIIAHFPSLNIFHTICGPHTCHTM